MTTKGDDPQFLSPKVFDAHREAARDIRGSRTTRHDDLLSAASVLGAALAKQAAAEVSGKYDASLEGRGRPWDGVVAAIIVAAEVGRKHMT